MTKAILIVSFGTTYPDTRRKTIDACIRELGREFVGFPIYEAYTSNIVIKRINKNEGIEKLTVEQAMEKIRSDGHDEVYIQPLHIIPGGEFHKIIKQVSPFKNVFTKIIISSPLLTDFKDYENMKQILLNRYKTDNKNEAFVLMGHGSSHSAFTVYAALDHMLLDESIYIACVESYPSVQMIEERLRKSSINTVHLAPFMLVAGDHATNDLISDEEDSWKTFFIKRGYDVKSHLVGLGEYSEVHSMYVEHLKKVMTGENHG